MVKTHAPGIAWLGALEPTENGVRDALSRLTVPAQRIYERLFWFFDPQAAAVVVAATHGLTSLQDSAARLSADGSPSARHDLALLSLALMLRLDPALKLADDWRRTYALWKELIVSSPRRSQRSRRTTSCAVSTRRRVARSPFSTHRVCRRRSRTNTSRRFWGRSKMSSKGC
jgi:hypothetical protein